MISFVARISIFELRKYWQTVFNLMEINMRPTFKQFLQEKTVNTEINKAYYKQYDVKIMINIPQAGNDETANIQEHTFKIKWDGLQSMNML